MPDVRVVPVSRGLTVALGILAGAVAVAAVLANILFGAVACSWDTSYCAESHEKDGYYAGTLEQIPTKPNPLDPLHPLVIEDAEPHPYRDGSFFVTFESRRTDGGPVEFHTDGAGHYCIVWPQEAITPFPVDSKGVPLQEAGEAVTGLRNWVEGQQSGPCEESDEGVPWHRAEDLRSSWQYATLLILPLAALGLIILSGLGGRTLLGLRLVGIGLTAASVLAFFVLWGLI